MKNAAKWAVLALGFLILLYVGSVLIRLESALGDRGGIRWSWQFVQSNSTALVILPMIGLIMVAAAFILLVRNGR